MPYNSLHSSHMTRRDCEATKDSPAGRVKGWETNPASTHTMLGYCGIINNVIGGMMLPGAHEIPLG